MTSTDLRACRMAARSGATPSSGCTISFTRDLRLHPEESKLPHRLARAPSIRPFARRAHLSTPRAPRATDAMLGDNGAVLTTPNAVPWLAPLLLAALAAPGCSVDTAGAQDVSAQAGSLREFGERTRAYLALRTKLATGVAAVSGDATSEQISHHQEQLAAAVRAARKDARQGDIFTPPVVPQFRTSSGGTCRRATSATRSPPCRKCPLALPLRVNTPWPADAPRATVPPQLLSSLYPLPEGLEYRFLDRHLGTARWRGEPGRGLHPGCRADRACAGGTDVPRFTTLLLVVASALVWYGPDAGASRAGAAQRALRARLRPPVCPSRCPVPTVPSSSSYSVTVALATSGSSSSPSGWWRRGRSSRSSSP